MRGALTRRQPARLPEEGNYFFTTLAEGKTQTRKNPTTHTPNWTRTLPMAAQGNKELRDLRRLRKRDM